MTAKLLEKFLSQRLLALYCSLIVLFSGCNTSSGPGPDDDENFSIPDELSYVNTYKEALAIGEQRQKTLLVLFTRVEFRRNCKLIVSEIIRSPEFKDWANRHVVFVAFDHSDRGNRTEENNRIAKKFGLSTYPIAVFVDNDGEKIGELSYRPGGPKAWIAAADKILNGKKAAESSSD